MSITRTHSKKLKRRDFLALSAGSALAGIASVGLCPEQALAEPNLLDTFLRNARFCNSMVEVSPLGKRGDDWLRLKRLMDRYAYKAVILLRPGTYYCCSKQSIPSGTVLIGSPGVRIVQRLEFTGTDIFNAAFSAGAQFAENPMRSTLAVDAVVGTPTVVSLAAFPVETFIRLRRGDHGLSEQYYRVLGSEGAGPYTLTLDRPIRPDFLAGDMIEAVLEVPKDIHILGNGMKISGTGDRYVELAAAQQCSVQGLHADTKDGVLGDTSPAMSLDIGGFESYFSDCRVDSRSSTINGGVIIESGEQCSIRNCHASYAGVTGLALYDCCASSIIDSHAVGCVYGALMASDGVDVGCRDCNIRGGTFWNNQQGILLGSGQRSKVQQVDCSHNIENGVKVATNEQDCLLSDLSCVGNQQHGVLVNADVQSVQGCNWILRDNCQFDIRFDASASVSNVSCTPCSPNSILVHSGSVHISDLYINHTLHPSEVSLYVEAAAQLSLSRGLIEVATAGVNGIAAFGGGSLIKLRDVVVTGPAVRGYVGLQESTLRREGSNDLQEVFLQDSSAHADSGTVTLDATQPVLVPYRDIRSSDLVLLTLLEAQGPSSDAPSVSISPGLGFNVQARNGNLGTYSWRIVG